MLPGVLVKAGATVRAIDMFYKAVMQSFLIYGSDVWVITDSMMKVLKGLHHLIAQRIVGNTERHIRAEG